MEFVSIYRIDCLSCVKQIYNTSSVDLSFTFIVAGLIWFIAFNGIFNNIPVILWWSVLLVEETRVPEENH